MEHAKILKAFLDSKGIRQSFVADRIHMLKVDAWRSFAFIAAAAVILVIFMKKKLKDIWLYVFFAIMFAADMVPVNRRYFGSRDFVSAKEDNNWFAMQQWEKDILQDKSLDYRVLNVAANTFNDARTSYRLKSIGGYHAAKLRRYQDLIDAHISKNNMAVVNMLNTKYFVTQNGVIRNPNAMGNAWFVDRVQFVETADDESQALWNTDLKHDAVADKQFADVLIESSEGEGQIQLINYAPNRLEYKALTSVDKVAVFSEIYYPHDWHLYIDGNKTEIGRVNYVLRAINIKGGSHKVVLEFRPKTIDTTEAIAYGSLVALVIAIAVSLFLTYRKKQA